MKTLKFMLAAATAIGLASASHAAGEWVEEFNTSGDFPNGDANWVAPADNESTVADGVLNVSVGTDPLTRMLSPSAGYAQAVDMTADDFISATITTDVKFTVTPAADDVTSSDGDKLLVYLKEDLTVGSEATNLMVKACHYKLGNQRTGEPASFTTNDYVVTASGVNVVPGDWYSLKVVAQKDNNNVVFFNLFIKEKNSESDYVPLVLASTLYGDAENVKIPSLHGTANAGDATLTYVGFAGEGAIDNLAFSKEVQVSYIDFTLAWSGVTPVSYTVNGNEPVAIASDATSPLSLQNILEGGETVAFKFTNADGVTKTKDVVAAADGTISASASDFTWADYLGAADGTGAYVIDDLAELVLFKKGVAKFGTSGLTFKLGANIDATDLGYFDGIGTASGTNGSSGLNNCTFDGAGYTISNVSFSNAKYRGFFNQVLNSTIKDLTINVVDIAQHSNPSAEHGYSAFAGNMKNSKIQNCVATGTIGTAAKPAMHTCGGFAVKSDGGNIFENCSNDVDIVCSLNDNPKIGGIFGLAQTGSVALTNCWNSGDLTITCEDCGDVGNGAGGLAGYAASALTIHGGGNTGTITCSKTTAGNATKDIAIKIGTIIAMQNSSTATITGGTVAQADQAPAGAFANVSGLDFATVDGNVATFVDTLAAGNTYKVMNAAATATYNFTALGTIAFDASLTAPAAYAVTAASGLAAQSTTAGNVKTYYATDWAAAPAEHPWYENPGAVVLAQNLPGQTGNIVSAFHGQGEGEYLGLTYSTNPLQFDLFTVNGTNTPTTLRSIEAADATNPGFRGVAISKILGIAMTLRYATSTTMYAYPLAGGDPTAVTLSKAVAFDAAAFSPDGKYLFSNAVAGENSNQFYVKWAVSDGGATLTRIGGIAASGRARSLAYARINGRDLVFGLVDTGKIAVIDMTGDDDTAWTAADLITGLPTHSYGTLCVSGVKVTGGTPHLTVATANNNGATKGDVLNVYALSVPATGTVTASLTKSFDEDALTAAGFGDISDANRYGNTVYVTEDEATIYFARPDNKLYAAQYYVAPEPAGEELAPGQESSTTYTTQEEATAAAAKVTVEPDSDIASALETAGADVATYASKFEAKVVEVDGSYKVVVGLTAAAEVELQSDVDAAAAEVVDDLTETDVTFTTTPGFYYSFEYGTSLGEMAEGARTLATGSSLTLERPTTVGATSGFYKVLVNVTDKQ